MKLRKLRRFLVICIISVTGIFALLFSFLNLPFSQRFATRQVNQVLAGAHVPVHIDAIRRILPNSLVIRGILITDFQGDTIIYAGELRTDCRLPALMRQKVILRDLELTHLCVNIIMNDSTRNYNIAEAFQSGGKTKASKPDSGKDSWLISIKKGALSFIKFLMTDSIGGIHIQQDVDELGLRNFTLDLADKEIRAKTLELDKACGKIVLAPQDSNQIDNGQSPWNFGLTNLSLNNIDFTYHQVSERLIMHLILGEGKIRANEMDFVNRVVDLKKISISKGSASIQSSKPSPDPDAFTHPVHEKSLWYFKGKEIDIEDVGLKFGSYNGSGTDSSETGLNVTDLEMKLSGFILDERHTGVKVNRLSFDLGNGFSMKKMKGELDSDTGRTKLDLEFETGNSQVNLKGLATQSVLDIISKHGEVKKANVAIRNTRLSLKDFDPFFVELKDNPHFMAMADTPCSIAGDLEVVHSLISLSGFFLSQDRNFLIALDGKVENPFSIAEGQGNLNIGISNIDTTWLKEILAGFGVENDIPDASGLAVECKVSNTFRSPDFDMYIRSNSGPVNVSGSLDFSTGSFSAQSSFEGINLGEVLKIAKLGSFYGSGKISGAGFSPEKLQADFSFMVDSLGFNGYTYTHTSIDGKLGHEEYSFQVLANDPFFKGDLNAFLIPSDSVMKVQVQGWLFAQMNELHLDQDTLAFKTGLEANLMKKRSSFEAEINASELVIITPNDSAEIQHLIAFFKTDSTNSILRASSDFFNMDVQVASTFNGMEPVEKGLREYLATFTDPKHLHSSTRVMEIPEFNAKGNLIFHPALRLFIQDTSLCFKNIDFSIVNKTADRKIKVGIMGSGLEYKVVKIGNLMTNITDSAGIIDVNLVADSSTVHSSPANRVLLTSHYSDWNGLTGLTVLDRQDDILYGLEIASLADSSQMAFYIPSGQLILNHHLWQTDTSKLLTVQLSDRIFLPALNMHTEGSSIQISTDQKDGIYNYRAALGNVALKLLIQEGLIPGKPAGSISGSLDYRVIGTTEKIVHSDLTFRDASWSGLNFDTVGVKGSFQIDSSGAYGIDMSVGLDSSEIVVQGDNIFGEKGTVTAGIHSIPIHIVQPFVKKHLSELSGHISGELKVSSIADDLDFIGHLEFVDAKVRINTLNTIFKIPKDDVRFTGRKVIFDKFTVLDSLDNKLLIDGFVDFNQDWLANLDLEISSSKLQVMNRSEKEDIPLYGHIFVDSRLTFKGPLSNPDVEGQILLTNGTEVFYRQMEDLSLSETERIVSFVNHSSQVTPSIEHPLTSSGMAINSSIETIVNIDPATKINFNLDKWAYNIDVMIEGGGRLNYQMLNNNQVALSGRYEISKGNADVRLIGWPNKSFRISEGGFIRWEGRVENPELSFEAVNRVRSSYTNPVDGKQRDVDFDVVLKLSQQLSDLDVSFFINTSDKYLMSIINTLSPEEVMKQAITILLFEIIDLPGISTTSNYMSQQVNQLLATQLNQLAKTTIQGVDISFGIDSYVAATQSGGEETKTSLSYEVRKSFLNNRAQIEFSGRMNDLTQQQGAADFSLNNLSFEYRLDSAASKYIKVYNEHSYEDVFTGEIAKTGVGFTYRKRYRSVGDIWRRKKKNKEKKNLSP